MADKKSTITDLLKEQGIDLQQLKEKQGMSDVDDFDFICHIAYGKKPLTRHERADEVRRRDIFSKYGEQARQVLEVLLDKYASDGITQLENPNVLQLDPLRQMGSPAQIVRFFGTDREAYYAAVRELEQYLYTTIA